MRLAFSFDHVRDVEFCVGISNQQNTDLICVPVDGDVKSILKDILTNTLAAYSYEEIESRPPDTLEIAEKYGATERLITSMTEPFMEVLKSYTLAENVPSSSAVLDQAEKIAFYYARFTDTSNRKIFGFRRASTFKAVLRARNRLIQFRDDTLKLVSDNIFKLDEDFDFICSGDKCLVLHPTGFEFLAEIQKVVAAKASTFVKTISERTGFIHDDRLTSYVKDHPRAAKLVTAIHSRTDLDKISEKKVRLICKRNGIQIETINGKVAPKPSFEIAFLEVLDRRRYAVSLIDNETELYLALSRKGVPLPASKV